VVNDQILIHIEDDQNVASCSLVNSVNNDVNEIVNESRQIVKNLICNIHVYTYYRPALKIKIVTTLLLLPQLHIYRFYTPLNHLYLLALTSNYVSQGKTPILVCYPMGEKVTTMHFRMLLLRFNFLLIKWKSIIGVLLPEHKSLRSAVFSHMMKNL
jgi:hypothetical protein